MWSLYRVTADRKALLSAGAGAAAVSMVGGRDGCERGQKERDFKRGEGRTPWEGYSSPAKIPFLLLFLL